MKAIELAPEVRAARRDVEQAREDLVLHMERLKSSSERLMRVSRPIWATAIVVGLAIAVVAARRRRARRSQWVFRVPPRMLERPPSTSRVLLQGLVRALARTALEYVAGRVALAVGVAPLSAADRRGH